MEPEERCLHSELSLARLGEKCLHDVDLERAHGDHQETLAHAEGENAPVCGRDGRPVSRVSGPEILLRALNVAKAAAKLVDGLFQAGGVLGNAAGFGGHLLPRLALDHDVKVDKFVGERGHVVGEAEGVFADGVASEDVVALTLALAVDNHIEGRICDDKVNVESAASLDSKVEADL